MAQNEHEPANAVQASYTPDQDRTLTEAVLDAIEDCKRDNLQRTDFVLYEDIDPDALNSLFRHDARPRTTVNFRTDGVEVELWGDGGVEIRVTDRLTE
ncbi:hypothetical protein HUG10_07765 [Halorarum halophilum]|uniref:Halobacterial output domain-containing protein n=1 Tax=Halorarum halophilum TaxID=2743090 RepID=A0A7D5GBG6_9EURY|nr:HalOD1 output domain-containing protein [Halobaculum halophilum]QLG27452.1 hypothetical protein HUG10_07765 [Halobaculum halophilum]